MAPFKSSGKYQLVFEAVRGDGDKGDIALDDVAIRRGSCSSQPFNAIPQRQVFIDCDFKPSICRSWRSEANKFQFNWTLSNQTGSSSTGFIYVDQTQVKKGDKARLITKEIIPKPLAEGYCLTFFYYAFGKSNFWKF